MHAERTRQDAITFETQVSENHRSGLVGVVEDQGIWGIEVVAVVVVLDPHI